ncbi:MAG: serine hydrolase, partial [Bacillota bacterium]|nr:serine hydrolase [Bacillota bacterium]
VFPYHRAHGPSSTLYSTVKELSLFAAAMMDTLEKKREDIIAPATLKTMMSYQAVIKSGERIGLGWFISDYADQLFYGHEGNDIGFRTTFAMIPQKRTAIIVLANLQTASTRKIMRTIYDMAAIAD